MPFSSLGCVGISYKWFLLPKAGKFGNWPPEPSGERDYRKDFWEKNRAWHRSAHLPRRAFAKPEKLFLVMPSMHQMKLSPLFSQSTDPESDGRAALPGARSGLHTAR